MKKLLQNLFYNLNKIPVPPPWLSRTLVQARIGWATILFQAFSNLYKYKLIMLQCNNPQNHVFVLLFKIHSMELIKNSKSKILWKLLHEERESYILHHFGMVGVLGKKGITLDCTDSNLYYGFNITPQMTDIFSIITSLSH